MDPAAKKRKSDENGAIAVAAPAAMLAPEDARKILESLTQEQLLDIVVAAMCSGDDPAVLDAVRAIADCDPAQRKLFIRGLGWETTNDSLRAVFAPFGDLEEAVVIADKATGRSKGYGFITFRHIDGALLALKEPSKKIDSRVTVTQLAAAGNTGAGAGGGPGAPIPAADLAQRKIYVGNVPADMASDRLLAHFASYGEIEEGPLGFDKQTGKFRGYALFVYKSVEAARASLVDPMKTIDGHHLVCKLANTDPKKGKPGALGAPVGMPQGLPGVPGTADNTASNGLGLSTQSSLPSHFGVPGSGLSSFTGYTGTGLPGAGGLSHHHPLNSPLQSSLGVGAPGLSSTGSQVPSSLGGSVAGGYGGGLGGPYGSSSQYAGPGSGGYAGLGMGSSLYRMPQGSGGMPSGGYPESGQYSLSSSAYQSQHHQPAGSSPGRRYPTGGTMYPNLPPYY